MTEPPAVSDTNPSAASAASASTPAPTAAAAPASASPGSSAVVADATVASAAAGAGSIGINELACVIADAQPHRHVTFSSSAITVAASPTGANSAATNTGPAPATILGTMGLLRPAISAGDDSASGSAGTGSGSGSAGASIELAATGSSNAYSSGGGDVKVADAESASNPPAAVCAASSTPSIGAVPIAAKTLHLNGARDSPQMIPCYPPTAVVPVPKGASSHANGNGWLQAPSSARGCGVGGDRTPISFVSTSNSASKASAHPSQQNGVVMVTSPRPEESNSPDMNRQASIAPASVDGAVLIIKALAERMFQLQAYTVICVVCLLLNVFLFVWGIAVHRTFQSQEVDFPEWYVVLDVITTILLAFEVVVRVIATRKSFWRHWYNWMDVVATLYSIVSLFFYLIDLDGVANVVKAVMLVARYLGRAARIVVTVKEYKDHNLILSAANDLEVDFTGLELHEERRRRQEAAFASRAAELARQQHRELDAEAAAHRSHAGGAGPTGSGGSGAAAGVVLPKALAEAAKEMTRHAEQRGDIVAATTAALLGAGWLRHAVLTKPEGTPSFGPQPSQTQTRFEEAKSPALPPATASVTAVSAANGAAAPAVGTDNASGTPTTASPPAAALDAPSLHRAASDSAVPSHTHSHGHTHDHSHIHTAPVASGAAPDVAININTDVNGSSGGVVPLVTVTGVDGVSMPLTAAVAAHRARMSVTALGPTEASNAAGVLEDDVALDIEPVSARIGDDEEPPMVVVEDAERSDRAARLAGMWSAAAAQAGRAERSDSLSAPSASLGAAAAMSSAAMTTGAIAPLTREASGSIGDGSSATATAMALAARSGDGGSTDPTPALQSSPDPYATSAGSTDATPVMASANGGGPPPTPPFAAAMPAVAVESAAPPSPQLRVSSAAAAATASTGSALTSVAEHIPIALPRPSRVDLDDIEGPASTAPNAQNSLHPHGAAVDLDNDADM